MGFLQNKFFFLWRAVWKCGNNYCKSEIAEERRGRDFPSCSRERDAKKVPECLIIDAQLDILRGLFLKIRIETLHTIHSDSQSDHALGLRYCCRSDPTILSHLVKIRTLGGNNWKVMSLPICKTRKLLRGFSFSHLFRFWICLCVLGVKARNITYVPYDVCWMKYSLLHELEIKCLNVLFSYWKAFY
jgi:hypothetical protein